MRPAPWFHDSGTKAPGGVGLYGNLPQRVSVLLWRHASFCNPGLWLIELHLPQALQAMVWSISHVNAVVDDFGTLVEVAP